MPVGNPLSESTAGPIELASIQRLSNHSCPARLSVGKLLEEMFEAFDPTNASSSVPLEAGRKAVLRSKKTALYCKLVKRFITLLGEESHCVVCDELALLQASSPHSPWRPSLHTSVH